MPSSISWMQRILRGTLYLSLQLMELGIPMVIALNMMDEVRHNGGTIHVHRMQKALAYPSCLSAPVEMKDC